MTRPVLLALALLAGPALALDVPLGSLDAWVRLTYNNIQPNDVEVDDGALLISIDNSASPLVYRLDEPTRITGVTVVASWSGELRIPDGVVQGSKDADDFVLKVGVVEAGDQTLSWLQRRIAADWIKALYRLAPEGSGVKGIEFLSTTQSPSQLGTSRIHPLSDLLHETRVVHLQAPGDFVMTHRFDEPIVALGLWLSPDGDNTGSLFDLRIERITLHTE